MYHVFVCDYDESTLKGSVNTLEEAYLLVDRDCAELYENTVDDLTLKHVADFFEESQAIDGNYNRVHRKRGWMFTADNRIEVMEEYTERWAESSLPQFTGADGKPIMVTGMTNPGRWVREE